MKEMELYRQEKISKRIEELEKENARLKEKLEHRNCVDCSNHHSNIKLLKAEGNLKKVEYTLKKIIETVQNDRIDEYGARLVLIKDFANECLEEIEK